MAAPTEILLTSEVSGQLWNICTWDPHSGTSIITYKGGSSGPRSVCILGKDYLLGAVNNKPLIHVWALQRKDQMQMRIVCPGRVSAMACSPCGNYCIAAIEEKIHVWQISTGNLLAVLSRHYQTVTCIKFTDDGSHFVTGGDDNLVLVWSISSVLASSYHSMGSVGVEPRHTWTAHSLPITDIQIGCGGIRSRVVSASLDQTVKIWEIASGELLSTVIFDASVMSVTLDNAECAIFAGCTDGNIYQVKLFERPVHIERHITKDAENTCIFQGHTKQVTCLSVSLDGTTLVSGSHDTTVKVWDIKSRQCTRTLQHKGVLTNVFFIPTPPNMLNPDAKPTLPLHQFKRYLHGTQQSDQFSEAETVPSRLRKRKHEDYDITKQYVDEQIHLLHEKTTGSEKNTIEIQEEIQKEVKHLRTVNREMYDFTVKKILDR